MTERDTLGVEIGAALGILGILLVFLPLFVQAAAAAAAGDDPEKERRRRIRLAWLMPLLIGIAALDAILGLLTLWKTVGAASATGWILVALVCLVAALAVVAVRTGVP